MALIGVAGRARTSFAGIRRNATLPAESERVLRATAAASAEQGLGWQWMASIWVTANRDLCASQVTQAARAALRYPDLRLLLVGAPVGHIAPVMSNFWRFLSIRSLTCQRLLHVSRDMSRFGRFFDTS